MFKKSLTPIGAEEGTTLENNIETYIYSIDLTTGELLRTVTLNGFELMTKLEGE